MTKGKIILIVGLSVVSLGVLIAGFFVGKKILTDRDAKKIADYLKTKSDADKQALINAGIPVPPIEVISQNITWKANSTPPFTLGDFDIASDSLIKKFQTALNLKETTLAALDVDGYFGELTAAKAKKAGYGTSISQNDIDGKVTTTTTTQPTAIPARKDVPIGYQARARQANVATFKAAIKSGYTAQDIVNAASTNNPNLYLMIGVDLTRVLAKSSAIGSLLGEVVANHTSPHGTKYYIVKRAGISPTDYSNLYGFVDINSCYY
jgi:hypothetical protein